MSLLYLDTARLGRACPQAFQAQLDFSRLSAEDPSMYCEDFFRNGTSTWPATKLAEYPALRNWRGIRAFKAEVAQRFSVASPDLVFLANRSAQLVRIAAQLMFRKCRNVLTSDLNWPHWQAIVEEEALRHGQQISVAPIRDAVFTEQVTEQELNCRLRAVFDEHGCDGVFIPAVTNLGVQLDTFDLLTQLQDSGQLRFSLIDAAQSFCHIPNPAPVSIADVTITGCHKWFRGTLPLGLGVCGRPLVAEQIRSMLNSPHAPNAVDDPLLRFSEEICNQSVNRYSETVNVAPIFTANAAVNASHSRVASVSHRVTQQIANSDLIRHLVPACAWRVVETDASLRTGIMLLHSTRPKIQGYDSDALRSRFLEHGIALSAYSNGLIRVSTPTEPMSDEAVCTLSKALARVA